MTASPLRLRLGRRLRDYRLRASLTQRQLGDRSGGIAAGEIWRFESGARSPNLATLYRLAQGLGCSVKELVDVDGPEQIVQDPNTPRAQEWEELEMLFVRLRGKPPEVIRTVLAAVDAIIKVA
jgi:transcriptional regulator with XRE-family HTH domain